MHFVYKEINCTTSRSMFQTAVYRHRVRCILPNDLMPVCQRERFKF